MAGYFGLPCSGWSAYPHHLRGEAVREAFDPKNSVITVEMNLGVLIPAGLGPLVFRAVNPREKRPRRPIFKVSAIQPLRSRLA